MSSGSPVRWERMESRRRRRGGSRRRKREEEEVTVVVVELVESTSREKNETKLETHPLFLTK